MKTDVHELLARDFTDLFYRFYLTGSRLDVFQRLGFLISFAWPRNYIYSQLATIFLVSVKKMVGTIVCVSDVYLNFHICFIWCILCSNL